MKTTEKIANAKKRIDELERLIKYWNDSDHDEAKKVNDYFFIELKDSSKASIVLSISSSL